jgi:hypothetical protein
MVGINDLVNVQVSMTGAQLSREGFGRALLLSTDYPASFTSPRTYSGSAGLVADGFPSNGPSVLAAQAYFGQTPPPPDIKVGKRTHIVAQAWTVTPAANPPNLTDFVLDLAYGQAKYTTDSAPTVAKIVTGLKTAIDALATAISAWASGHGYVLGDKCKNSNNIYQCVKAGTSAGSGGPLGVGDAIVDNAAKWQWIGGILDATDNTTNLGIAVHTAGIWGRVSPENTVLMDVIQSHADGGIASDLTALQLIDDDWYGIINPYNSSAEILAAAAWTESAKKLFPNQSQDTPIVNTAPTGATDIAAKLEAASYTRSPCIFHPDNAEFADAAWFASRSTFTPGQETWAYATLAGIAVTTLTPTQMGNASGTPAGLYADGKCCNIYVNLAGANKVYPGTLPCREFVDIVRLNDWITSNMQADVGNPMLNPTGGGKLPFDDGGIIAVKAAMLSTLMVAVGNHGLVADPKPTVGGPRARDVAPSNKRARLLTPMTFNGTYADAIQAAAIVGVLTH